MQEASPPMRPADAPLEVPSSIESVRTSAVQPALCLVISLAAAFIASELLDDSGWLSPIPPSTDADPNPVADVAGSRLVELYRSAFTAWAALLLFAPAAVLLLGGWGRSNRWRNWWTVSFLAFAIHMFWSMVVFFEGDVDRMTSTSRVSAFWPGVVLLTWWAVDVGVSWMQLHPRRWVEAQRHVVHALAFVLFVGGSAATGETLLIRLIGGALVLAVVAALVRRFGSMRAAADAG